LARERKIGIYPEEEMAKKGASSEEVNWTVIGRKLYWLRQRVNMAIFQFAERLHIPEEEYERLEAGSPNPELLERLSRYYVLSLRWFYDPRTRAI
jgi:transcriptional regulator with XRE-family HTH domain